MKLLRKAHHFSSHLPLLMQAIRMTSGDVLEMGTGFFSTSVIHWMCVPAGRFVLSLETDAGFIQMAESFSCELHRVELVTDWDTVEIDRPWSVVFIDHWPAQRRKVDVKRLANYAQLIVIHDTNGRHNRHYHLNEVWPLFKYSYHYGDYFPATSLVSNFVDLSGFRIC